MKLISVVLLATLVFFISLSGLVHVPTTHYSAPQNYYVSSSFHFIKNYQIYPNQHFKLFLKTNFTMGILITEDRMDQTVLNSNVVLNNYTISDPSNFTQIKKFKNVTYEISQHFTSSTLLTLEYYYNKSMTYTPDALNSTKYPLFPIFFVEAFLSVQINGNFSNDGVNRFSLVFAIFFLISMIPLSYLRPKKKIIHTKNFNKSSQISNNFMSIINLFLMKKYNVFVIFLSTLILYTTLDFQSIISIRDIFSLKGIFPLGINESNLLYQFVMIIVILSVDLIYGWMNTETLQLFWSYPLDRQKYYILNFLGIIILGSIVVGFVTGMYLFSLQSIIYSSQVNWGYLIVFVYLHLLEVWIIISIVFLLYLITTDNLKIYFMVIFSLFLMWELKISEVNNMFFVAAIMSQGNLIIKTVLGISLITLTLLSSRFISQKEVK